jgi:hypothetical protein
VQVLIQMGSGTAVAVLGFGGLVPGVSLDDSLQGPATFFHRFAVTLFGDGHRPTLQAETRTPECHFITAVFRGVLVITKIVFFASKNR